MHAFVALTRDTILRGLTGGGRSLVRLLPRPTGGPGALWGLDVNCVSK